MVPPCRKCDNSLAELDCRRESLKREIEEFVSVRKYYISRNEKNEKELKRMIQIKEDLTYLKDILLRDFHKIDINAGKRKKLFTKKIAEFQEKNHATTVKLENLPGACQLQELLQSNEESLSELFNWNKKLDNLKEEHSKMIQTFENDLRKKIIEFSEELSQMMKAKGDGMKK